MHGLLRRDERVAAHESHSSATATLHHDLIYMKNLASPAIASALLILAFLGCRETRKPNAPSWARARVLSANEDHPSKIIADGSFVYFVTGGTIASQREQTNNIKRIALKDGAVSVFVKGGDRIPDPVLAADEKFLYWSDGGNVFRVSKLGGESEIVVANAPHPDQVLIDGNMIYWSIWTGEGSPPQPIMLASINGQPRELTPAQRPTTAICLDGGFLYWMTGAGIKKIAKTGGEISDFYSNPNKTPSLGLEQDAGNFYFCQMNSKGNSALMKLSKKGGDAVQIAPSINHTLNFVVDEQYVYYFDDVPGTGSFGPTALRKVSKSGGPPETLDQGEAGWIKYLAVDANAIYFTDIARVYSLPK